MPDIFIAEEDKKEKAETPRTKQKARKREGTRVKMKKNKNLVEEGGINFPKNHKEAAALPGHSHNPLASFCYFPDHVRFVNQDPEEKVVLLLRRHPITNLGWIVLAFFLLVIPAFITILPFFTELAARYQIIFFVVWYLFTGAFVFVRFIDWYFNVNIITDERVIDVDFVNLVYREVTDAETEQIQDVTVEIGSAIRTAFNYGDVLIQTASQVPRIEFQAIPQPDRVAKILRELRVEEEVEKLEGRIR